MMSKPKSEATEPTTASTTAGATSSKPTPADAVADLERRLADLSTSTPVVPPSSTSSTKEPSPFQKPVVSATTTTTTTATSNKNALLARIIAAQERAKQAQPAPVAVSSSASPPSFDFFSASTTTMPSQPIPPPAFDSMMNVSQPPAPLFSAPLPNSTTTVPPPPSFDDAFFAAPPSMNQQHLIPTLPPAFDSSLLPPAPPPMTNTSCNTSSFMQFDPMSASAPAFEDLIMDPVPPTAVLPPPVPPPTFPATTSELDDETLQAILGIDGLSHDEKQELIREQLKIMKSIEESKKTAQVSAADAFEQRSFSAAVQAVGGAHKKDKTSILGMERTHQAIADGTAVVVQCLNCGEWMQVTGAAQFMMCSSCNTMTQVQEAGMTNEEAQQMIADAKLAEQLQKEEYEEADRAAASNSSPSRTATAAAKSEKNDGKPETASSGTWMEWLGFGTPAPAPVSRASNDLQLSYSRDSADDSTDGLLGSASTPRRQGARVATQQPLFACVTDSISSAANYAISSAQGLNEDEEGNVHGVDASSLLAVTQVGRGSSNQSYEQMPERN